MDPKVTPRMFLAPQASPSGGALKMPGRSEPPSLHERLVRPETREEQVRGRAVIAMPALAPHGDRHFKLDYVVGAYVKPGYVGSTDLLTRAAEASDFATDTCIRKEGTDPRTGTRYLEELAFEVVHEQSLRDITARAEELTQRGVRRLFAIFVKKGEVHEWAGKEWRPLSRDAAITDPTLSLPIGVTALLDAAEADDAVARALVEKNNPVIAEVRAGGLKEGLREGQLRTLERQFEKRLGRPLSPEERATLGERVERLGNDRIDEVLFSLSAASTAAWLADPVDDGAPPGKPGSAPYPAAR
jgi:hypothetical protein